MDWINELKREVAARGLGQVARELNVSKTTISLCLSGKYQASTDKIRDRVTVIYAEGGIDCPVLGTITPMACADSRDKANKIGLKAGNPESLKLYVFCLKCGLNGN